MAPSGTDQHVLVLVEDDLRVGGHLGLQFAAGVVDGDPYFERGHIVFLDAHRRNLGYVPGEGLVLERLHPDAPGCPR